MHKKWGEKELIMRFAKKGDIVGHRVLGNELVYPVSDTVLETSTVCFISNEFFLSPLKVSHGFLYTLMLFFAEGFRKKNAQHSPHAGKRQNCQCVNAIAKQVWQNRQGFHKYLP